METEIYKGSITWQHFERYKKTETKETLTDTLLDWRLSIMNKIHDDLPLCKKIQLEYEIEATDRLIKSL